MSNRIEFIGIPGSGKSTLFKSLYKEFKRNSRPVLTFRDSIIADIKSYDRLIPKMKILIPVLLSKSYIPYELYKSLLIEEFFLKPNLYNEFYKIMDKIPEKRRSRLVGFIINNFIEYAQEKKIKGNNIFMIDEGLVQHLAAIGITLTNHELNFLDIVFNETNYPSYLFAVTCPIEECLKRMQARKRGIPISFRHFSDKALIDNLYIFQQNIEIISEHLKESGTEIIHYSTHDVQNKISKNVNLISIIR